MNQLEYVPGTAGQNAIQMDGPASFVGTAEKLRGREWQYDLGYRDLLNANRPAREVTVTFWAEPETANDFRRAADADVMAKTPGTLIAQGEWKQRAYVLAAEPKSIHYDALEIELKIALMDGAWWRLESKSFFEEEEPSAETDLDYPFDYPHDYMSTPLIPTIEPSVLVPSDVHFIVYGPVTNPAITIGTNVYQVNVTVPAGGYLTVDGREKTIVLTLADGTPQNKFGDGVRGSGEGGGTYIFEPVKAGVNNVTWDGTFGFDFGWYEEEGEPPWKSY